MDLFVGTLANSRSYGIPQTSYLLLNDSKGNFSIAGQDIMTLTNIGMVTSASFNDINKDGWSDLVVAGEWMPLTVFINNKGRFNKSTLPGSSGWWQTLLLEDVNGDGHTDILAGNWGCNTKFWSGKNGPVRLYVSDFDKNGRTDQLLSYTSENEEYPFLAKDEVERALPVLKKHYLLYADYAGLPMKDAFYGFAETVKPLMAERMASVVCYGDGIGSFTITDLPADLQLAPIMSFHKAGISAAGENVFLTGGNFFEVIPYEGRYDAQPLSAFCAAKTKEIRYLHQPDLLSVKGQVRDIRTLQTVKNGKLIAVTRNNDSMLFLKLNKE
jgi:hypothetical protein